ncbi:MAG: imidazole glycerol phosphate synthase subunit HisH [Erysipelotrichaceae bacterium]|nr:imidazole glycerol phosphate synthase subunit HisH [Erysipelotrichaceae bacterium]
MIAIIDYGVGNLFSLRSSFDAIGQNAVVTRDEETIRNCEKILLPGVGAFEDAAKKLRGSKLDQLIKEEVKKGKPLLGICLGMQLLFDSSEEYGHHEGLGLIPGTCRFIGEVIPKELKIPHMGWNELLLQGEKHPLFRYIDDHDYVYFVHSYAAFDCAKDTIALTDYGAPLTAAVAKGNVMGTQFHPEKSGEVGLKILKAFCEMQKEDL